MQQKMTKAEKIIAAMEAAQRSAEADEAVQKIREEIANLPGDEQRMVKAIQSARRAKQRERDRRVST